MESHRTGQALWPNHHLFVTADTPPLEQLLQPGPQLEFLRQLSGLVESSPFAESLVYSTPYGNTGWTAFRCGQHGHVTYHHWDQANPGLLQLDLSCDQQFDIEAALRLVERFWQPSGLRAYAMHGTVHGMSPDPVLLQNSLAQRLGRQEGLGPGSHLHALLDFEGVRRAETVPPTAGQFDEAIANLVKRLKMRPMTYPMSAAESAGESFKYIVMMGITTSHVSLRWHQSDDRVQARVEAFSCRDFDPAVLLEWFDGLAGVGTSKLFLYNRHPEGKFLQL